MEDKLLKVPQIMDYLGVSRKTFDILAHSGKIPVFKVGGNWRADLQKLKEWANQQGEVTEPVSAPTKTRGRKPQQSQPAGGYQVRQG